MPFPLHTMYERYENDPKFRAVVDALTAMIANLEMTPSEVRECAMLACMRVESMKPIAFRISREDAVEFFRRLER